LASETCEALIRIKKTRKRQKCVENLSKKPPGFSEAADDSRNSLKGSMKNLEIKKK